MALSLADARVRMREHLDASGGDAIVILDDRTEEYDFGWIFYPETRAFVETGDPSKRIPGLGPTIVIRGTGRVEPLASADPAKALEEFRRRWSAGLVPDIFDMKTPAV